MLYTNTIIYTIQYALSLRNLVLGDEFGRVFPAGVGPDSPSRDGTTWLSTRFSRSLGTRRRFSCVRAVFTRCAFRAPIRCPSGGGGTRESGGSVAESLVGRCSTRKHIVTCTIGRVSTRFGEGEGKLDRSRARGVLKPCAQESKARTGRFSRGKLISGLDRFSSCGSQQGATSGQNFQGRFPGLLGALDDWMLARALASPAQSLHRH